MSSLIAKKIKINMSFIVRTILRATVQTYTTFTTIITTIIIRL